ncbi:hypothetical protein MA16_Dca020190 [Dendrobium catenatum]|uniref:Uncharacterized protein n=1 Tax=Dendrobium catenatum TaxID=906689 RepID=A0A2I0WH36_9ASPA|nr:hypothetical protein MA16_Dca020190 [Dendrobium catenatum]
MSKFPIRQQGKDFEGTKLNSHEGNEESTHAISTPPAKQRSLTATTKREDDRQETKKRRMPSLHLLRSIEA